VHEGKQVSTHPGKNQVTFENNSQLKTTDPLCDFFEEAGCCTQGVNNAMISKEILYSMYIMGSLILKFLKSLFERKSTDSMRGSNQVVS